MFDSAHTERSERGLLVSGESYTVDVSYGLWLPLVFLLGKRFHGETNAHFHKAQTITGSLMFVSGIFPVTFYSNLYAAMAIQLVTRTLQIYRSVN